MPPKNKKPKEYKKLKKMKKKLKALSPPYYEDMDCEYDGLEFESYDHKDMDYEYEKETIKFPDNKLEKLNIIEKDKRNVLFSDKITSLLNKCYEHWEIGDCVFISASTGLGKTHMIREGLYEYAQETGSKIAILVNRNALRMQQLEEFRIHEIKKKNYEMGIRIYTYQQIEQNGDKAEEIKNFLRHCRYVVCDEAHYFIADATFNLDTHISFDFITSLYKHTTLIFISATLGHIRPFIEQRMLDLYNKEWEEWYGRIRSEYSHVKNEGDYSLAKDTKECQKIKEDFMDPAKRENMHVPIEPKIREYQYDRDISGHLEVRHFRDTDDILQIIKNKKYPAKWLIFVSSRNDGMDLRDKLEGQKKIVYVDADYDSPSNGHRDEAKNEMMNIRKNGVFSCDILISTSVLDCGINIEDPEVKNIVLLSNDEDSFKQLLGRRRFLSENEKLNLFIQRGKMSVFKRWMEEFEADYCDFCEFDSYRSDLRKDKINKSLTEYQKHLPSTYNISMNRREVYPLTAEAVYSKFMYCEKVYNGLKNDENFFLKEQLKWVGKEFSEEWLQSSDINVSQGEADEVTEYLNQLYDSVCIIDSNGLKDLWDRLHPIAKKLDPLYKDKKSSMETVKKALTLRKEWEDFSIQKLGDRVTYYEILYKEKPLISVKDGITAQDLEKSVKGKPETDIASVFKCLFEKDIPDILKDIKEQLFFMNYKLKSAPGLEDKIIKTNKKNEEKVLNVTSRGNR